jgi:hypothetical protein
MAGMTFLQKISESNMTEILTPIFLGPFREKALFFSTLTLSPIATPVRWI